MPITCRLHHCKLTKVTIVHRMHPPVTLWILTDAGLPRGLLLPRFRRHTECTHALLIWITHLSSVHGLRPQTHWTQDTIGGVQILNDPGMTSICQCDALCAL